MKHLTLIILILWGSVSFSQSTISGTVKDKKGRPVAGSSITIKDSYDGATSDSLGKFTFQTTETGEHILTATSVGYKPFEITISVKAGMPSIDISLKEEMNELTAVTVTAGAFEASDRKRASVLSSLDVVTTASANADITGALKTLPGTQQVGEKEGLFVRGGSGEEAKVFIDGTVVNNFFLSSVPDIASRGRFSPFLFKGTVFSSGGYSALYGQALSGALILETIDLPAESSASLGISSVGLSAGYQQLAKNKKSSWGIGYNYTNLYPYFKIFKQAPDYFTVPQLHNGEGNFRIKTSKTGILKFYGYFNTSDVGLRRKDIDSTVLKDAFGLKNFNVYTNLSWKEKLGEHWKMSAGLSYSNNIDKINNELQNQQHIKQDIGNEPFDDKNFKVKTTGSLAQGKIVLERHLMGISMIRFGSEYLYYRDETDFSNVHVNISHARTTEHFNAVFGETDIYMTNDLAAKLGGRFEYSSILKRSNIAPRASLAYKIGKGQTSFAYGIFYQKPERTYLMFGNGLQYQRAEHYILNYQKINSFYTFRTELFYKKYKDLVTTFPDTSNHGYGNAKGVEFFWRDKKTFKGVDYWISYSYLDTKRNYLNYPIALTPNFAAKHTTSLVVKKFFTKLKAQLNGSYTFATGRPYYRFSYDNTADKYFIADQGKTINYNNLSLSINYLPSIGNQTTKRFIVWVLSVSNVLGSKQVFNYNYSYNGARKEPITPTAGRFVFLGCFLSFGVDRSDDIINGNL